MATRTCLLTVSLTLLAFPALAGEGFEMDVIKTSEGDLEIAFIGHGTLMFSFDGKVIHIDPWTKLADYTTMPKADLILITHEHRDHFDNEAIKILHKESTVVVANRTVGELLPSSLVMKNGDEQTVQGIKIEAVPAYNVVHKRDSGEPFHPKGVGNGYVLTFGDKRVYVAGDTENIPEMKELRDIYCAFLPMNLPYTMAPEMAADAAKTIQPKILYPYHFGETDTSALVELLEGTEIDVRIRKMQ
ncbi:MAG TPA: MBL fold metallo-hydrolase [Candidatus Hydrogenedentes bacterium]|nr:MBL fold metallo-hydrolase [Candidatus Hydrogenedentota bacterium]HIJ73066.1 MBL fold metallo-hydrolase [Candidatus Hydrogenedentota bacterium]